MKTPTILEQMYLHNNWANLLLLEECEKLNAEQLDQEIKGTFGTIRGTLRHIAAAQERYAMRLDPGWTPPGITEKERPDSEELRKSFEASAERLLQLATATHPDAHIEGLFGSKTYRTNSAIVLVQAIHHGNDHRTQIATMMSLQEVEPPMLDSWTYGDATGQIVEINQ